MFSPKVAACSIGPLIGRTTLACVLVLLSLQSSLSAQMLESQRIRGGQSMGEPSTVRTDSHMAIGTQSNLSRESTQLPTNSTQFHSNVQPASFESQTPAGNSLSFRAQTDIRPASSAGAPSGIELKGPSSGSEGRISKPSSQWTTLLSVGFSLCIVVCLFLGVAWVARKSMPASSSKLPNEVLEVLGRSTIAPRQQVYVLRFGRKLLLVSQQPGQTQTLSEITDEEEVIRLAGICEANAPRSSTRSFSEVLKHVATGKSETQSRPQRRTA